MAKWPGLRGGGGSPPAARCRVSLRPSSIPPVPEATAAVARAAFRRPPLAVRLRDEFGTLYQDALYQDADFAALFPARGQPALPP